MPGKRLLAAVDLGSNSFRLLIARLEASAAGNRLVPLESIREGVRLADGLRDDGTLDDPSRQRALGSRRPRAASLPAVPEATSRARG